MNAATLEARIKALLDDDEVQNNRGIYEYVLTGNEKSLNLRAFDDKMKRKVYEQQGGVCRACKKPFDIAQMEADHIVPWHKGGKTILENCQILCMICNRTKGDGSRADGWGVQVRRGTAALRLTVAPAR